MPIYVASYIKASYVAVYIATHTFKYISTYKSIIVELATYVVMYN